MLRQVTFGNTFLIEGLCSLRAAIVDVIGHFARFAKVSQTFASGGRRCRDVGRDFSASLGKKVAQ